MSLPRTLFAVVMMMASPALAQDAAEYERIKAELWTLEQGVYASRAQGDFQPYVDAAAANYIAPRRDGGWTPGKDGLRQTQATLLGNSQEKLDMNFRSLGLHGDTAVIYYHNHRTVRPNGTAVDEWFEVMHVWNRDPNGWVLVASMPRQIDAPPDAAALAND